MKDIPALTFNQAQGTHTLWVGMLGGKHVDADPLGFVRALLQLTPMFGDALWMLSAANWGMTQNGFSKTKKNSILWKRILEV